MKPLPMLTFGAPANGWLPIRVGEHEIYASDVPCDSIQQLTSSLLAFICGSKHEIVEWSLEPEYERWIFKEEEGVISWIIEDHRKETIHVIHSSRTVISQIIVRGLRYLHYTYFSVSETNDHKWSWPFPIEDLKEIESKISDQVFANDSGGSAPS